jgi:hypothetical protein
MHGIKYFFSIKITRQFGGGGAKKISRKGQLPKSTIFQNPGARAPPGLPWVHPDDKKLTTVIILGATCK